MKPPTHFPSFFSHSSFCKCLLLSTVALKLCSLHPSSSNFFKSSTVGKASCKAVEGMRLIYACQLPLNPINPAPATPFESPSVKTTESKREKGIDKPAYRTLSSD